ncbi:MAG: hypothetical protein M3R48_00855 [Candidatus Dormibacteraeota bacterium]|nr:hypothetical protein [Candidatus Dormibacteraeota bacterium]
MLIQDFVQVRAPFDAVCEQLRETPPNWLAEGASAAYAEGEQLVMRLTTGSGDITVGKRVQLDLGTAYPRGEGIVVPMSWWATGAQRLFPTLDADLEVMPLGSDQVMVTLMGRYEPPLGPVGRSLDRLVMHRVAEICIRGFLRRAAASLERRTAAA